MLIEILATALIVCIAAFLWLGWCEERDRDWMGRKLD